MTIIADIRRNFIMMCKQYVPFVIIDVRAIEES